MFDHYPLAIQTADPRAAASLRDLFYLLGGAVYLVKLKSRTFLRLAGILPSDPSRIGHHPAQFLFDLLRQIREKDRIIITLAHLSPIEARKLLRLRQKHLRLGKNRAIKLVETAHDLTRKLHMRGLIYPHRDLVGFVHDDIRRLQDRVSQESVCGEIPPH